jgi:hypothetical protein
MTRHHKKPRAKLLRSLYIWHRYIGLATALFIIILSFTGLALNHTEEIGLDSTYVSSTALLDWYGVREPASLNSYQAGAHTITEAGERVYWNTRLLGDVSAPLIGAVEYADLVIIAVEGRLLLFTPAGELIEQLGGAAGVPAGMQAVGTTSTGMLIIHAAHGYYQTNPDFLEWHEGDNPPETVWASATEPPETLALALLSAYRGSGLSLERVLLDIHSGRILGNWGVYLMDAAAVLFLLLAISGLWLWGKRRSTAREHQRRTREKQ